MTELDEIIERFLSLDSKMDKDLIHSIILTRADMKAQLEAYCMEQQYNDLEKIHQNGQFLTDGSFRLSKEAGAIFWNRLKKLQSSIKKKRAK